jgi:hypothetical protein
LHQTGKGVRRERCAFAAAGPRDVTSFAFDVTGMRPAPSAASPTLLFALRITRSGAGSRIHALALRATIQIDARRRRYEADEQHRLYDVFGEPAQWERSLKPLVWTHATLLTPAFDGQIEIDLPVPCTYDFDVAAAKYLHAVRDGDVPLLFLFSGTVFFAGERGFAVAPVSWDSQATCRMPARAWREAMDHFFPGSAWIRISRETLDALHEYKSRHAAPGWDAAFDLLLQAASAKEHA